MNDIGSERFRIQLICDYPCDDKYQLRRKNIEKKIKKKYENKKKYRNDNKGKIREMKKIKSINNNNIIKVSP